MTVLVHMFVPGSVSSPWTRGLSLVLSVQAWGGEVISEKPYKRLVKQEVMDPGYGFWQ